MLRETLTGLGPFYIKFGQLLSIRPDLISAGEMEELQKLCDKVPSPEHRLFLRDLLFFPTDVFPHRHNLLIGFQLFFNAYFCCDANRHTNPVEWL